MGGAKETVYAIYVLNPRDQRLVTVVSLREIMLADAGHRCGHAGEGRRPITVGPLMDREDVARLISKYNLLAIPVLDDAGHVLGIVTVDDVIDALISEPTEDVQKFGGMAAVDEPYMQIGLGPDGAQAGRLAVGALFLGEMLTAAAMGHFEHEISRAVVLALFIPLIISSGGNSGSQATSLIIRAMALAGGRACATGGGSRSRELPAGLALGGILGAIGFLRILLWQRLGWYDYGAHYLLVAATVALSLVGVVLFGSLAGSMLPFVLRRVGLRPGERVGAVRRHAGGRDRPGDLLHAWRCWCCGGRCCKPAQRTRRSRAAAGARSPHPARQAARGIP